MATRKTPSQGSKPDRLMREALSLELHQEVDVPDPATGRKHKVKKLRLVQLALVNKAIRGDVPAIKEINERMDGKVAQPIRGPGPGGAFLGLDLSKATDDDLDTLEQIAQRLTAQPGGDPG